MATLGTINPAVANDRAHLGEKVKVFPFTAVSDADTWASGINSITRVAWEPTATDDQVAVTFSGATVTFSTSGVTTHAGNLIVWCKAN